MSSPDELPQIDNGMSYTSNKLFTSKLSKLYKFENLPEPGNATEVDDFGQSKVDTQNNYNRETIQQPQSVDISDEVYNNPNLHSEEQEEFEIPDDFKLFTN
ncbi:kinase-like domain-containing protein [Rhizophagus clarus]|uniref:Kinase-like domain-containing protein n=1 Tax=Rhizophagus clarus TaxID=94130 RepID=A0A8H3QEH2_9GLOM|nr:kinase-like domain-containing protein [Rhizophagus clarus]